MPRLGGPGPALAVDIGGSKLAAGVVDADGRLLSRAWSATPAGAGADGLWRALRRLVDDALTGGGPVSGVGVGCGGPMDWPAGLVSPLNIPGWRGFPLRDRLAADFPGVPVRVHNDAVALAVGEHWRGGWPAAGSLLGLVVSTGVGGGLVLDGRVRDGPTGNAGHLGHLVVDPAGPACACGGFGCLEAVARGPAVAARAVADGWRPPGDGPVTAQAVAAAAAAGDQVAAAALARAGRAVGQAVASAAALLDLDVAAVGGGLAGAGPLLFRPLRAAFRRHAGLAFTRRCRVGPGRLGADAGLVGAAALVLAGDRYWSAG